MGLLLTMLYHFGDLSSFHATTIGAILFAAIFGYTSVMDQYKWSIGFEWFRIALSFFVLLWVLPTIPTVLYWAWIYYLVISCLALAFMSIRDRVLTKTDP